MTTQKRYGKLPGKSSRRGLETKAHYELFYGTGGHGGPYHSMPSAVRRARRIIAGSPSETGVSIRPWSASGVGGYGQRIRRIDARRERGRQERVLARLASRERARSAGGMGG